MTRTFAEGLSIITTLLHLETPGCDPEQLDRLVWLLHRYADLAGEEGLRVLAAQAAAVYPITPPTTKETP